MSECITHITLLAGLAATHTDDEAAALKRLLRKASGSQ